MTQEICKNCGNHFKGKFCNNCGEKIYTEHDKSMQHFLHEALHFFTHLDGRFLKTVVLIFTKPGKLSVTYCSGARNKYYKPFSLFVVGIILYLLFPQFKGLNLPFASHMVNAKYSWMGFIADIANQKAIASHISMQELAEKYDHKSPGFAKILLLIFLPLTGLVLKLLFPKKRKYFFDYLVLSTESGNIMLYVFFFILPLAMFIISFVLGLFHIEANTGDMVALPIYTIFVVWWAVKALMMFFDLSYT
ncbi:MAG: DUF3667 domain-containing protein [Ferruginibacter sp.]